MARLDLKTEYLTKYVDIAEKMLDKDSIFDKQLDNMKTKFDEFGLTNEQLAEATTQMFIQVSLAYNKDAIGATNALIKQEATEPTSDAQTALLERQKQGYDDNTLNKINEQKASVASFAVNSGSGSAQSALDSMNQTMDIALGRVQEVTGQDLCPALPTIVPPPTNLGTESKTDTTITISWSTVINATSYELFIDGVSAMTTSQSINTISSLVASTKYSFAVRAYVGTLVSNFAIPFTETTDATP